MCLQHPVTIIGEFFCTPSHPQPSRATQASFCQAVDTINKCVLNWKGPSFSDFSYAYTQKRKLLNFSPHPRSLPSAAKLQIKQFIGHFLKNIQHIASLINLLSVLMSGAVFLPITHTDSQKGALHTICSLTTAVVFNFYPTFNSIASANVDGVPTLCQEFLLVHGIYQQARWGRCLPSWSLHSCFGRPGCSQNGGDDDDK